MQCREAAMTRPNFPGPAGTSPREPSSEFERSLGGQIGFSATLTSIFRGKFCEALLPNRKVTTFKKDHVIYNVGDSDRTFVFLQNGFVKLGAISPGGHEVIYDVRKAGDIVGELSISESQRSDRCVALEQTDAVLVPAEEVLEFLQARPEFVPILLDGFCQAKAAYAQVNTLALDDIVHRLAKVLITLAARIGERSGSRAEIPTYLTQEEIAQMVGARRERISTALNALRRQGMVEYTARGHLVLDMEALVKLSP
jgi:CRP/FNR family cyclic AMP-dependent transcriptional regulator